MRSLFEAMLRHAEADPARPAFSDPSGVLRRGALLAEAGRLGAALPPEARRIGLLMPNGREWAVAEAACLASGRIAVPLPGFFTGAQIAHVIADAGIDLVLTEGEAGAALPSGVAQRRVALAGLSGASRHDWPAFTPGYGTVIYTSGSTGRPKGVRHENGQVGWTAAALAAAIEARDTDVYLSVLPHALLLETICAFFIPALVGGTVHFDTALADAVGRGAPSGLAAAFARHRPTTAVLVPELLRLWVGELAATGVRAPETLRFVAVGGAAVPAPVAEAAWRAGIPVHEGYGLSECCSVVAVNRPGRRVAGTVGEPLPGLSVRLDDGEIHVAGPCVSDGYLHGGTPGGRWVTGDLGQFDATGCLVVNGRRDALIITPFGRNVSPEWVETVLLSDPRIGFCAVGGTPAGLAALVVPAPQAAVWFEQAGADAVKARLTALCETLPRYARPGRFEVIGLAAARAAGLLTENGRIRRSVADTLLAAGMPAAA